METQGEVLVFPAKTNHSNTRITLWITAAVALIASIGGFVAAVFGDVDQLTLHLSSTLPACIGVFALIGAVTTGRGPTQVRIDDDSLELHTRSDVVSHPWQDLAWARVDSTVSHTGRVLKVYGTDGRQALTIYETVEDFDRLIDVVQAKLADQPEDLQESIRNKQGRKQAVLLASISVVMLGVAGANIYFAYQDQMKAARFERDAVFGEGKIVRKFVAPNGVTKRLEYEVTNDRGESATHNAEVDPLFWELLPNQGAVPVEWVPDAPHISRLAAGEVVEDGLLESPVAMYVLSGLIGCMCLLGLAGAVMSWCGWDIDLDSKTGKVSIKRFGEGR